MQQAERETPGLALKIGIAGALTIGAVASGYFVSRQGRRVLREAIEGRRRTRIEDRVLDALWGDRAIGARSFDVKETGPGAIVLSGRVASESERSRAIRIANDTKDVQAVEDRLEVKVPERRRFLSVLRA
jgi:osmotically-inducible protein OsmY